MLPSICSAFTSAQDACAKVLLTPTLISARLLKPPKIPRNAADLVPEPLKPGIPNNAEARCLLSAQLSLLDMPAIVANCMVEKMTQTLMDRRQSALRPLLLTTTRLRKTIVVLDGMEIT